MSKAFVALIAFLLAICTWPGSGYAAPAASKDSDHDGLSDQLEAALLKQFAPVFMISRVDCSVRPAEFAPANPKPTVLADNGTIYGQAFPRKGHPGQVELHYYDLWPTDCGEMGHPLDAEHVSVLVEHRSEESHDKALYWYAAAHEDTVCDASQMTRAETIHAEDHGATVWISEGKHAAFLSALLCQRGCGGDHCPEMERMTIRQIVNLGEADAPMDEAAWIASPEWPLRVKLTRSDFSSSRLQRLEEMPQTDIVWANPAKRPAQAAILGVNAGIGGAATGARATNTALVMADGDTSSALTASATKTRRALGHSSWDVWKALKKSAEATGGALGGATD